MSSRVTFADLLKVGAEKDKQRRNLRLAEAVPPESSVQESIAPEKDFNKRANSLERDALPKGLFPGASKAIYDALYLRTLGAVEPTNLIQATRKQIMDWSNVKNIKTINAQLKKLEKNGFIKRSKINGEPSGNYYKVYLPKQLNFLYQSDPKPQEQTQTRPRPDPDQTQTIFWSGSGLGNPLENKGLNYISLKTKKKSDDEPAALDKFDEKFFDEKVVLSEASEILRRDGLVTLSDAGVGVLEKAVNQLSKKLIGKELKSADNEKLKELAEMLVMELEIAAARTDSISNVPAFLTEHLRRRLSRKQDTRAASKTSSAKSAGKSPQNGKTGPVLETDAEIYRAEPLSEQARETVLKTMLQYAERGQSEFVLGLQDTYTAEDWKWLTKNLEIEKVKK